jgi:hypothetical protein
LEVEQQHIYEDNSLTLSGEKYIMQCLVSNKGLQKCKITNKTNRFVRLGVSILKMISAVVSNSTKTQNNDVINV